MDSKPAPKQEPEVMCFSFPWIFKFPCFFPALSKTICWEVHNSKMSLVYEPMKVCVNCGFMKEEVEGKKEDKKIRAPGKNIVKVILKQRAACSLTSPKATHILHTYTWREPYTIFIQNKLKAQFDTLLCIRIVKDENSNLAK